MSAEIGILMRDKKIDEANKIKEEIANMASKIQELEQTQEELSKEIEKIIDLYKPSFLVKKDD